MAFRIQPHDGEVSGGALGNPADHLHGGGLACPVGAKQSEGLAGWNAERDAVDGGDVAIRLGEVFGGDDVLHLVAPGLAAGLFA
ncbi:hypothetical protein D9M72_575280 [compost metagenome]